MNLFFTSILFICAISQVGWSQASHHFAQGEFQHIEANEEILLDRISIRHLWNPKDFSWPYSFQNDKAEFGMGATHSELKDLLKVGDPFINSSSHYVYNKVYLSLANEVSQHKFKAEISWDELSHIQGNDSLLAHRLSYSYFLPFLLQTSVEHTRHFVGEFLPTAQNLRYAPFRESTLAKAFFPHKSFRGMAEYRSHIYSDSNQSKDFLLSGQIPLPISYIAWSWLGVQYQQTEFEEDSPLYWSPKTLQSYAVTYEAAHTFYKNWNLSLGASMGEANEDRLGFKPSKSFGVGIQYGHREMSFIKYNFFKVESKTWKEGSHMLSLNWNYSDVAGLR